jgi:membrane protease YdiL (CAAX protease family)
VSARPIAIAAVTCIAGAALLWGTFHTTRGDTSFWAVGYGLAAVWIVGALAVGGVRPGRVSIESIATAVAVGLGAFGVVYVAYRLLRDLPVVGDALDRVVGTADAAHVGAVLALAVVNAVAEELFFRGALGSVMSGMGSHGGRDDPWRFVAVTTVVYAVVTAASFNLALVLAALGMGALFAVVAWRARGVVAPSVCHVTWSTLMLVALHR